jgi:signal recognition particle receptor subunit beta
VVDSADAPRMGEARESLDYILLSDHLAGVPLLLLANKQDFDGALDANNVKDLLNIKAITDRPCHVQACCGVSGEGLDWLAENMP